MVEEELDLVFEGHGDDVAEGVVVQGDGLFLYKGEGGDGFAVVDVDDFEGGVFGDEDDVVLGGDDVGEEDGGELHRVLEDALGPPGFHVVHRDVMHADRNNTPSVPPYINEGIVLARALLLPLLELELQQLAPHEHHPVLHGHHLPHLQILIRHKVLETITVTDIPQLHIRVILD